MCLCCNVSFGSKVRPRTFVVTLSWWWCIVVYFLGSDSSYISAESGV